MSTPIDSAHLDGYRITLDSTEEGAVVVRALTLCFVADGELRDSRVLQVWRHPADVAHNANADIERTRKLYAAMTRFINEGGTLTDVATYAKTLSELMEPVVRVMPCDPCCIESEEAHARTYLLPEQRYLHVVEDDFSEVLTAAELSAAMEADKKAEAASGDEFGE